MPRLATPGSPSPSPRAGSTHTCALFRGDAGAGVECWGGNDHGQLGTAGLPPTPTPTPTHVGGIGATVTAIAAGGVHACALAGGAVRCWGANADGQLGNGASADTATPASVQGLSGVTAIAAGGAHTCALTGAGGVECWGLNAYGQLGNGTTTSSATPVPVSGLSSGVTAIATGNAHSCALTGTGGMVCWGFGLFGQLGNGSIAGSLVPVAVTGLSGVTAIAAGGMHSCALAKGGNVSCWGDDQSGQLGDNQAVDSPVPVTVAGTDPGAIAIAAGTAHTCVLSNRGGVQCWGWNVGGQLGDDTNVDSPAPVKVFGF